MKFQVNWLMGFRGEVQRLDGWTDGQMDNRQYKQYIPITAGELRIKDFSLFLEIGVCAYVGPSQKQNFPFLL